MSRSNLLLRGGLMFVNNTDVVRIPFKHSRAIIKPINIELLKSPVWTFGIVSINNLPYYRVLPHRDNYIEIKTINEKHFLLVNDRDIYRSFDIFTYNVNIKLNDHLQYKSYPEFIKYY